MIQPQARREKGIDEVIKSFALPPIEKDKIPIPVSSALTQALEAFKQDLQRPYPGELGVPTAYQFERERRGVIESASTFSLTPQEINTLLQTAVTYEEEKRYHRLGTFVSTLIQRSYNDGKNDFYLDLTQFPLRQFPKYTASHHLVSPIDDLRDLHGSAPRPLTIVLEGDSSKFGCNSRYIDALITGNVHFILGFAEYLTNSNIAIRGDVNGSSFARKARGSTFFIGGKFYGKWIGGNNPGISWDKAEACTFKSPNYQTALKLAKEVPDYNDVIYVGKDGERRLK